MRKTFYTNQALKYRNGEFTGSIDDGERKIIINFSDENHGSLFVYNLYTRPHEVIRGIKQGEVTRLSRNEVSLQGYGYSSNGFPIDDLSAKVNFDENEEISSVEFIKSSAEEISIVHKSRENLKSSFFFELFCLQDIEHIGNPVEYISTLNKILDILPQDIQKIKHYENRLEFSIAGEFLSDISTNSTVRVDQTIHTKTCLTGFYFLFRSAEMHKSDIERYKLIELVHKNVYPFLGLIIQQLLRKSNFEKKLPFKGLSELDRAKNIFMLMECYLLYISNQFNILERMKFVIEDLRNKLDNDILAPFNFENSLKEIENIYQDLFTSIEESLVAYSNS